MPNQTGPVRYSQPRAAQIAARYLEGFDADDKTPHSAVHGELNVLVETSGEAKCLIDNWDTIMQAAAKVANGILSELRDDNAKETESAGT